MRISIMSIYVETAFESLNKHEEELCGDHVDIIRTPEFVLAVLADGLGSGVKANILATMTSRIISSMMSSGAALEEVIETVASTLPVCSVRGIAYSTFSILQIFNDGQAYLAEFDNPAAVFLRKGRVAELPRTQKKIADKNISEVTFTVQPGDRIVIFSDGALHAGVGKLLNLGWQHKNISEYLDRSVTSDMTAVKISTLLVSACDCLYQGTPGDDTTVLTIAVKKPVLASVMIGPPEDASRDEEMVRSFLREKGKKIICGGTTSQIVSRISKRKIEMALDYADPNIPPISHMKGIDLVTEGIITLGTTVEYIKWCLSTHTVAPFENAEKPVGGATGFDEKRQDGATALAKLLMDDCTQIHFFIGKASNPAYRNPALPLELNLKLRRVTELKDLLESMGKSVVIDYY